MGMIVPTLSGDAGVWDDELNAALGLVDAHDHTPGKGVKVPVSGLNINANLPFNGNGLTTVGSVAFSQIAAPSTGSVTLFVNTADHELYWRNAGGTNVKLTAGGSINTTLVGGIVGDYAAVGAEVAYDDANKRYTFKQQGTKPWARMASADVRIYEFNTVESVYTALKAAAALAASYEITLPVALGATAMPLIVDASGTGTFGTSFSLAPNANVTLSGTGALKTGNQTITIYVDPLAWYNVTNSVTLATGGIPGSHVNPTSDAYFYIDDLPVGARVQSVKMYGNVGGGGTITRALYFSLSGGTMTAITGATSTSHVNPTTLTPTAPAVLGAGQLMWLRATTDGVTDWTVTAIDITFDIP